MLRDPFYRQIEQALEGPLDPQLFERCMGDLLRADYPWIVPVSGGSDSGMDGAIADGEGEPFPLVCTTAADVIGNLTRSLDSYLKNGLPRRKVVLATSRKLTTPKRANLFKRAREKDFELLQIFEREGIADRLTGSPKWCKDLLGLTWKPSALSTLPRTSRPLIDIEPVGREEDLAWIVETSGDRVLSGEPGSGKTFLFHYLIRKRDWPGLFLVDKDLKEIRAAWLEQRPRVIVVDDAHVEPDLLSRLVRLRQEMEASFEIVAVTWNGGCAEVTEALGVPATRAHKLELLTRDEILQVIQNMGVQASEDVLRDLVSQSANKPGLAVTIASLWKQGSYQEVLDGTALTRTLTTFFRRFLGPESTDVLACLALGGDRGMSLKAVAGVLRLTSSQTREIASGLSSGGVISQVNDDVLAVWPRKLRYALLRSVLFPGIPTGHDYRSLLDLAPSRRSAVETIVASKLHRAEIPIEDLRKLVLRDGSQDAWRGLASLSQADAIWALEHYPGDVIDIAYQSLMQAPEATILRLLKKAEEAGSGQPFWGRDWTSPLNAWIRDLDTDSEEMVQRRRVLASVARQYLRAGGRRPVGLRAVCLAFSPSVETSSTDPGAGRTVSVRWGHPAPEEIRDLETVVVEVCDVFQGMEPADWHHLSRLFWAWLHPSLISSDQRIQGELEQSMLSFATTLLTKIASFARGKPALTARLRGISRQIEVELSLEPDPLFELLFPVSDSSLDDQKQGKGEFQWDVALNEQADQWASCEPATIAETLARYEQEAQGVGRAHLPRGDLKICKRIATRTAKPVAWLDALLARGASGVLTSPFIEVMVAERREGWEQQAERLLDLDQHARPAIEAILQLPSPPRYLLDRLLERLSEHPQLLEILCLRRKVPLETLRMLLHHPRWELAVTAAIGEWNSDRVGGVRPELASDWRTAMLRAHTDDTASKELRNSSREYWLGVVLSHSPDLAFDWLVARLRDTERPALISRREVPRKGPFSLALSILTQDQRLRLVEELEKGSAPVGFVGLLVEKDSEVFQRVLASETLRGQHLEVLEFLPDESWMDLALLALGAGHELDEVVRASLSPKWQIRVMWGPGSEDWQEHESAFARFETDPREQIREIARRGQELAAERCRAAEERERQIAIHGRNR